MPGACYARSLMCEVEKHMS